ncbi:MAG: hypothetical protein E7015_00520 [Alphaproteobacteria bacterium]|nr:hypothetical protein [Alphaproteobacteria bacterium]
MLEFWRSQINNDQVVQKIKAFFKFCQRYDTYNRFFDKIPQNYRCHAINIFIIIISYSVCSLWLYPKFSLILYFKEVFSILCIYGAIFCWFMDKISQNSTMRICVALTACLAPVFFMNNSFGVAITMLLLFLATEYVVFQYVRGVPLFSDSVPVYIVCETFDDLEKVSSLCDRYKVLESIVLSKSKSIRVSGISSLAMLEQRLNKCNLIPFIPSPRCILYHASVPNVSNMVELIKLSNHYSISLRRIVVDIKSNECRIMPLISRSMRKWTLAPSDKNALVHLFKGKNIWICFDGRVVVKNLIVTLGEISIANLTVICDSESLVSEIRSALSKSTKCIHIKVAELSVLLQNETTPDFLFYNLPIKSLYFNEEHLKESFIKNVLDTNSFIKLVQEYKIPCVYALSSAEATNANNWTGATQRFGELLLQYADFYHRKNISKFKVIRLPGAIEDGFNIKDEIINSLLSDGCIRLSASESELTKLFNEDEIFPLLVKSVVHAFKTGKSAEVITLLPNKKADVDSFISEICSEFGLKKDIEVPVFYGSHGETMELDSFPNISEPLNETSIKGIYTTAFVTSAVGSYTELLTADQISQMSSRDIISTVFQSLSEKTSHRKPVSK